MRRARASVITSASGTVSQNSPPRCTFDYNVISDRGTTGDTITDFTKGVGADVLDVSDLLDTFAGYSGTNAFTGGYLHFHASGANTIVQVDSDGGGNSYVTLATLSNVTLTATDTDNYVV